MSDTESIGSDNTSDGEWREEEPLSGPDSDEESSPNSSPMVPVADVSQAGPVRVGNIKGHPAVTILPYTESGPDGVTRVLGQDGPEADGVTMYNPQGFDYVLCHDAADKAKVERGLLRLLPGGTIADVTTTGKNYVVEMLTPKDDKMRVKNALRNQGIKMTEPMFKLIVKAADPAASSGKAEFEKAFPEAAKSLPEPFVCWVTVESHRKAAARKSKKAEPAPVPKPPANKGAKAASQKPPPAKGPASKRAAPTKAANPFAKPPPPAKPTVTKVVPKRKAEDPAPDQRSAKSQTPPSAGRPFMQVSFKCTINQAAALGEAARKIFTE